MKKDPQTTDEFEPIELGSVSEETKGRIPEVPEDLLTSQEDFS